MSSSTALNPQAAAYYPKGYIVSSSSQAPPLSPPAYPHYYPNLFQPPPPPPPSFIYRPLSSPSSIIPHPPTSSPPPVLYMHDPADLPRRDNACFTRRGSFGRGGRRGGHGSRGWFSRLRRRAYDRRNDSGDSVRILSEEMKKIRIVEPRDVSKKKSPVVPVKFDDDITTVMIRNIPNKYTRELLIEFLDNHCKVENEKEEGETDDSSRIVSAYDFVYLPLDFRRKANLGYAFVNFTDPRAVWRFHTSKNNQMWELFYSSKVREVAAAKLQGKEQLMKHFESTFFSCESDEFLPVTFSPPRDGKNKSVKQRTRDRVRTIVISEETATAVELGT